MDDQRHSFVVVPAHNITGLQSCGRILPPSRPAMDETKEALAYGAAVHWFDSDTGSWYRFNKDAWRGWRLPSTPAGVSNMSVPLWHAAVPKPAVWRPWTRLVDNSRHPYIRWFQGGSTNITFSALDAHCLDGCGSDVRIVWLTLFKRCCRLPSNVHQLYMATRSITLR